MGVSGREEMGGDTGLCRSSGDDWWVSWYTFKLRRTTESTKRKAAITTNQCGKRYHTLITQSIAHVTTYRALWKPIKTNCVNSCIMAE